MKLKAHFLLRTRLLPALVVLAALMQVIDPYPVWTILLVALGGAWLLGYLWVRSLARNLSLRREMRFGWAQVGDRLEERYTLRNKGLLSAPWVEIRDQSDIPGYESSRVTGIGGDERLQWRTQGICTQRGVFNLGPTRLVTGDPLGIYYLELVDPSSASLIVMPPVVPLPEIGIAPGGRTGEGQPRANAPEQTVTASSVRTYLPGDSLRLIHWRTSARRNELFIRLMDGTPAGDWWVFLDLDQQTQAGQGWDSTTEHSIILAASLADEGLRSGQAVGFAASSQEPVWLPPKEGEGQRWDILRRLATVRTGSFPLNELLLRNKNAIGQGSSLVLVTANTDGAWVEALVPLMWRGITPTVVLLDPHSFSKETALAPTSVVMDVLSKLGVRRYVISRDYLDRPEARPGHQGQWEFRISPFGRAVPINRPMDASWKSLS